jgi:fatty-acyl-CoA synthase
MPAADLLRKMRAQPELPTAGPAGSCVGRPMVNVPMRVVRPDGTDCAPGEAGELWVGGPVVCGGYWGRPDATAAAIVDGWFRTGDALSVDAEGFFYVRGRLKEMYKSGGENVYPAEVEQVIGGSPGVGQVAVLGVPDPRWGEVGHAFVEPAPGAELRGDDLLRWLDGRLARFKIPKRVTVLDALPRTGSGKIDKPALARLLSDRPLGS